VGKRARSRELDGTRLRSGPTRKRGRRCQHARHDATHFIATMGEIRHDDRETLPGLAVQPESGPARRRLEFGAAVHALDPGGPAEPRLRRRMAHLDPGRSHALQECLLCRRDHVEPDELEVPSACGGRDKVGCE
jgi:hypothetical protein